jgi:hypothetical protein
VQHWADGGETSMGNLVLLCRTHHRLVHEAGYGVEMKSGREIVFSMPDGKVIPQGPDGRGPGQPLDRDTPVSPPSRGNVFEITADTAVPHWHGERMDNSVAVDMLLECE